MMSSAAFEMPVKKQKITAQNAYVEAALPLPLRQTFTYRVPAALQEDLAIGTRMTVPFGRRTLTAYAVELHDVLPADFDIDESKIRDIIDILDEKPLITPEILELTKWAADYYASFWGEMLKASLPAGLNSGKVRPKRRKAVRLLDRSPSTDAKPLTEQQKAILEALRGVGGEALFADVIESVGGGASAVNTLAKRGYLELYVEDVRRDPLKNGGERKYQEITLSNEQQLHLDSILSSLTPKAAFNVFLLHGVTGSGKTEVYIRAMQHALSLGRTALMLVPEISLTPVFSRRLQSIFGSDVAILHSNLSAGERFDEWRRIRSGDARVVIGTRSAVFAPLEDLGLIVVDEEHDPSYRQHESPFYNARDVAVMRAHKAGAVVILGSATPSMETFFNAKKGKYTYLHLPERFGGRGLAKAELIDMRDVFKRFGKDVALSPELLDAIRETHERGEQSIVLLNRRGFSQFVLCRMCGESLKCRNCDITLTYHRRDKKLLCHYCSYKEKVPEVCPHCESEYLYFVGEGTENITDQLAAKFPSLRIARVDRDTMAHKGEIDETLLSFAAGNLDMLVGTQMIAKGHDFPNVTLVGVVSVDIGLGLPDLRSAERTFQLITQVAGRAGRGEKPGRVLIQTYYPEHYALRHAGEQDYEGFYAEEIKYRERFGYPPFYVLASILIKHRNAGYAVKNANLLRGSLDKANRDKASRILGPAQASIARLKSEFRFQIILKSPNRKRLRETLETALADAEHRGCDMRTIFVEIDPVNLM
ncbi:MAG: primosomal protein N' [Acidobacteria bacterium]|nr:primosomal protein N' [Acidobacteriota bacterium]